MEGVDEEVSNEVDKRIIEMEFKNEQFEKEASKTLNTLDALKQKLNNNFSTKGAEELNQAIRSVDVSPLSKGIDAIQIQFSALQIAGKRVIENIVDAVMKGIADVKNKLTGVITQIKVGGSNRAQNIEQAKFMLSGLGIEWKDIVDDINYGVQDTAYGLDAAAKVASQLVASNVSLGQDMQASLRGVSGVAAMTNSTYEEIGHIFTSIAGQGKLMTMQLQQFSLRGLNVAADLAKAMGTTEAAVREMVTKGQIDFMTFAKAMDNLYGEHAKDANKTFTGALSNTKAALSRLGADIAAKRFETIRQVLVKIIPKLKELKTAMKPVEDGINSAMEAVGKLVEYLVDRINVAGIVEAIAPKIQRVTNFVKEFADTAREYIQNLDNTKPGKFVKNLQDMANTTEKIVEFTKEEIQLAKDIWNIGIAGNGEERVRYIEALGDKYKNTQAAVDKFIDSGYNWDALVVKAGEDTEAAGAAMTGLAGAAGIAGGGEKKPTTIYLIIDALYNLSRVIKNVVGSAVNIVSVIKDAFKEVFTPQGVAGQVNTFAGLLADISDKLYVTKSDVEQFKPLITFIFNIMKSLGKVILTLAKWALVAANKLADIFNKIRNSEIVKKILDTIGKAIGVIADKFKTLFNYLKSSGLLDRFVNILKVIAEWIGVKIANAFVFLANHAGDVIDGIAIGFKFVVELVESLINKLEDMGGLFPAIKEFFLNGVEVTKSWVSKIGDKLVDLFGGDGEDANSIFKRAFDRAAAFGRGIIEGLNSITWEDLKNAGGIVARIATVVGLLELLGSLSTVNLGIAKFFWSLGNFFNGLTSITRAYALRTTASAIEALGRTILMIAGSIALIAWTIASVPGGEQTVNKAVEMVTVFVALIGLYEIIVAAIKRKWNPVAVNKVNLLINARKLAIATILGSIALFTFSITSLVKSVTKGLEGDDAEEYSASLQASLFVIGAILGMLVTMMYAMTKMAKDMSGLVANDSLEKISKLIKVISSSITKLSFSIVLLTTVFSLLPDSARGNLKYALMTMGGVLAILVGVCGLITHFGDSMDPGDAQRVVIITKLIETVTKSITKLALIFIALTVVMALSKGTNIGLAIGVLAGIIIALGALIVVLAKLKINAGEFNLKIMALSTISKALTLILLAFAGLALALGKMNEMGVDAGEFMGTIAIIGGIILLITLVGGLIGSIPGITRGLEAFGVALMGLGVAIAGIGGGVLMLVYAMFILEKFIDKIDEFYDTIQEKKDVIVATVGDLIGMIAAGLFVGLIQALNNLINNMEPIVEALLDTVIALFNTLGSALSNRASELAEASYVLVEGIVKVVVEVIAAALAGIIAGLLEAANEIADKIDAAGDQLEGYKETGQWKDSQAENAVARINSTAYDDKTKAAWKEWLKLNGYDEEGHRTEDWVLETTYSFEQAYDIVNKSKSQEYAERNSSKAREYVPFDTSELSKKNKEEVETLEKDSDSIADSMKNIAGNALESKEAGKLFNFDMSETGSEITAGMSNLGLGIDALNMDIVNLDSMNTASDVLSTEAEETATSWEEYQSAVNQKSDTLAVAVENMAKRIQKTLEDLSVDSQKYGAAVVDGFVTALTNGHAIRTINSAAHKMADSVKSVVEKELGIASPSKVFMRYGEFTMQGFANGITDSISTATEATQNAGEATILSMRETLKRMSLEATNSIDTNPRITPVLDLSNVTEGIGLMDNMIDTSHAVRLGAITSTEASASSSRRISAFYQNGSNFDDTNTVGAITSLQGEVSTLKDAINGMQVVIDGRALVGQIATPMDKALGRKVLAGGRKV